MAVKHGKKRDSLVQYLSELTELSIDFGGDLKERVDFEIQKLAEDQFNVAVVGQFKRGKSTFINAILRDEIVPTAVIPLTSIVTIIKYGESLKITVDFRNGPKKEIPPAELKDYVTEKGNPNNEKNVKQVIIEYPSDFLKRGVVLIDTPGVGSVFEHNTDITYSFLPKLDAAIFLFTIDSPVAKNELEFLEDVSQNAVKIFFVLNKVDYADRKDIEEAVKFTKGVLEENLDIEDIRIHSISAKMALNAALKNDTQKWKNSGVEDFLKELNRFISEEKRDALLASVCNNALKIISQIKFAAELELKALTTPMAELEEKIKKLKQKIQKIEEGERDILFVFEGETKGIFEKFQKDYEDFRKNNYRKLEQVLERYFRENSKLPTKRLVEDSRKYITEETLSLIDTWREEELDALAEVSQKITQKLVRRVESIILELQTLTADIFDIKFDNFVQIKEFEPAGYFYYNMEPEEGFFMPTPLSVARWLPGFIAKKMVINHLRQWLQKQFDRQCGRVRYDVVQRMEKTFKNYVDYLKDMIQETKQNILKSVEKVVEMKKRGEASSRDKINKLKEIHRKIKDLEIKIINLKINCPDKTGVLIDGESGF